MSTRVEAAVHCCLVLHWLDGQPVTSARLADFFGLPPAYLQKTLRVLVADGIAEAARGQSGGFTIARAATAISLMDIVAAIEGRDPAFQCEEIRLAGTSGQLGPRSGKCAIANAMGRAELAYRAALSSQSIADIDEQAGPTARNRTITALS